MIQAYNHRTQESKAEDGDFKASLSCTANLCHSSASLKAVACDSQIHYRFLSNESHMLNLYFLLCEKYNNNSAIWLTVSAFKSRLFIGKSKRFQNLKSHSFKYLSFCGIRQKCSNSMVLIFFPIN